MNSETDLSLAESLTPFDSASLPSKTRGRTAHATWAHSRPAKDNESQKAKDGRPLLYCRHCPESSTYATSVTTNFRRHLETKHATTVDKDTSKLQQDIEARLERLCIDAKSIGHGDTLTRQVLQNTLNSSALDEALTSLIVVHALPFRILEWPEFHVVCRLLNPESKDYIKTAHSTVPAMIETSWNTRKDVLRKKLQAALSSIHLSLDIWTSTNQMLLLGICAHFVDYNQEGLSKALIALRPVANHSGAAQFSTLLPVLQDYGINRKLGCIIGDNASTNDTLCRTISSYLQENEDITWDPTTRRLRCMGHIINLAVQAFLFHKVIGQEKLKSYDEQESEGKPIDNDDTRAVFRALGPLGKLHNIVVHIRGCPIRRKAFKELAGRLVPLDNRTRWNSWYKMLEVANRLESAIDTYTKAHLGSLKADYLSPDDWNFLRITAKFLDSFHRATLATEGDQATIDRVLFTMDILIQVFKKGLVSIILFIIINKNMSNIIL